MRACTRCVRGCILYQRFCYIPLGDLRYAWLARTPCIGLHLGCRTIGLHLGCRTIGLHLGCRTIGLHLGCRTIGLHLGCRTIGLHLGCRTIGLHLGLGCRTIGLHLMSFGENGPWILCSWRRSSSNAREINMWSVRPMETAEVAGLTLSS